MDSSQDRKVNPMVVVFVLFHAFVIFAWSLPQPSYRPALADDPMEKALKANMWLMKDHLNPLPYVREEDAWKKSLSKMRSPGSYVIFSGTWQYWDMFAPNPANTDIWLDAVVTYEDGTEEIFHYPRMKELPLVKKYFMERYRKYTERLSPDIREYKWPQTAYWVAAKMDKYEDNPPVHVILRRHFREYLAPTKEVPHPEVPDYAMYEFYSAGIDVTKLREVYE